MNPDEAKGFTAINFIAALFCPSNRSVFDKKRVSGVYFI